MNEQDFHFYEPVTDTVSSTIHSMRLSARARSAGFHRVTRRVESNLAPYSFFNAFNYKPPIIGFCSVGSKDSIRNILETGEFVWNLATRDLSQQMNATAAHVPPEIDELRFPD